MPSSLGYQRNGAIDALQATVSGPRRTWKSRKNHCSHTLCRAYQGLSVPVSRCARCRVDSTDGSDGSRRLSDSLEEGWLWPVERGSHSWYQRCGRPSRGGTFLCFCFTLPPPATLPRPASVVPPARLPRLGRAPAPGPAWAWLGGRTREGGGRREGAVCGPGVAAHWEREGSNRKDCRVCVGVSLTPFLIDAELT